MYILETLQLYGCVCSVCDSQKHHWCLVILLPHSGSVLNYVHIEQFARFHLFVFSWDNASGSGKVLESSILSVCDLFQKNETKFLKF